MKIEVKTTTTHPGGHCEGCQIDKNGPRPDGDVLEITMEFENHNSRRVIRLCPNHARQVAIAMFDSVETAAARCLTDRPVWDLGPVD